VVASSLPVQPALRVMVRAGMPSGQALRDGGASTAGPVVVARDAQGALSDLTRASENDTEVEAVAAKRPDGPSVIWHSWAHVLAQTVQQHFPGWVARRENRSASATELPIGEL
jgi:hypothetical protein